jgi:hypothetical protein
MSSYKSRMSIGAGQRNITAIMLHNVRPGPKDHKLILLIKIILKFFFYKPGA